MIALVLIGMTKLCDQLTKYVEHLMYGNKNIPRYYVFFTRFTEPHLTTVFEDLRSVKKVSMPNEAPMKCASSIDA